MIGNGLFRRTYFITIFTILVFFLLGSVTVHLYMRYASHFEGEPKPQLSAAFFARMIDGVSNGDRLQGFKKVEGWQDDRSPFKFKLLDASGRVLYPSGATLPFEWESVEKPAHPYETKTEFHDRDMPPPPPGRHWELVRFEGAQPQYLLLQFSPHAGPPPRPPVFFFLGSEAVSVLLGVGVALFLIFRSLREKALLADNVLAELQKGNLKARFPIGKMDEIGQAMRRFNSMADEIERLVAHLRSVEGSRVSLLQELAHDLRTPIASLRSLLETLQLAEERIDPALQREVLGLALKETNYFERLVEDLLVLAQVSEPRYHGNESKVDLSELLGNELDSFNSKYRNIELDRSIPDVPIELPADVHLLERMIRNLLENAYSFAKSRVRVRLEKSADGKAVLTVADDGPGFSAEALKAYGERRVSRALGTVREGRVSVGLGSVIIKTVARIHRGAVTARNNSGAEVSVELPV